jgi:hypothetical protein
LFSETEDVGENILVVMCHNILKNMHSNVYEVSQGVQQQGQVNVILEFHLWCDTERSLPFSPNLSRLNVWLARIPHRITVLFAPLEVLVK